MKLIPVGSIRNVPAFKAVYFDLDGTLLDENLAIPETTVAALSRLKTLDVRVGVATGRMYTAAAPYVSRIRSDAPLILYNGARIVAPETGETLWETSLEAETARAGLEAARRHGVHANLYVGSRLFMDSRDRHGRIFLEKERLQAAYVEDLRELLTENPVKALFIGEPVALKRLRQEVAEQTEGHATLVFSEPHYLEMLPEGVSKGRALASACQMMKIGLAEVAAFGDAPNDADMLRKAGAGVVMENGGPEVRQAARYITGPNNGNGIVDGLNALFPSP